MPPLHLATQAFYGALLILSMTVAASAQTSGKTATPSTAALAKPTDAGPRAFRLFKNSRQVTFKLVTSWIPGENRNGMLRYKLTVLPIPSTASGSENDADSTPEAVEALLNRVADCSINLLLFDKDGFILRQHNVPFNFRVDEQHNLVALNANDSFQMDAEDYRLWISEKAGGGWSITSTCDPA